MQMAPDHSKKIDAIHVAFAPVVGQVIERYQTAEIFSEGDWGAWADLPLRLYCSGGAMVSIAWSKFDDLWLSNDDSTHFQPDPKSTRWVDGVPSELAWAVGGTVVGASLGRGEMSLEGHDVEIWTRLIVNLGDRWLEVYNALDENGYSLHDSEPAGEFVKCI